MMEDSVVFYRAPQFVSCHVPDVCMCLDPYVHKPYIPLMTNIHGKAAVYFYTGGHGGDNFKFRVYTDSPWCREPCLVDKPENVFTNWRRIYVDYAWMEDRGTQYPTTCSQTTAEELKGDHQIAWGVFESYKGVFDDCFIEIVGPNRTDGGTDYRFRIQYNGVFGLNAYADNETGFHPPPKDTIQLLGVDHTGESACASGNYGATTIGNFTDRHFHSFCSVGNIHDNFILHENRTRIDRHRVDSYEMMTLFTAAHELGHNLFQGYEPHTVYSYGLMQSPNIITDPITGDDIYDCMPDNRSYLHSGHIILLRIALDFDLADY